MPIDENTFVSYMEALSKQIAKLQHTLDDIRELTLNSITVQEKQLEILDSIDKKNSPKRF